MKKEIITMLMVLVAAVSFTYAQMEDQDCAANLSIFAEHYKVKNYDAAYEPWMSVRKNCPNMNVAVYVYGEKILKYKVKDASGAEKDAFVKDLLSLYDEWVANFPMKKGKSDKGNIYGKKGKSMVQYEVGTKKEQFEVFDNAFKTDRESFTDPKALYLYFEVLQKRFKENDPGVTLEQLYNTYEEISEKFEDEKVKLAKKLDELIRKEDSETPLTSREKKNMKVYRINSVAIGKFQGNMNALVEEGATCENLIPLYQKNFEENKGNSVWLKRAARRMDEKECTDDPMFVTLVEALHTIEPSADSAYYLSILYAKRDDVAKALDFLNQSIDLEDDNYKKADKLYKAAAKFKKRGMKSKSRTYARHAINLQPSMGRAYILIAKLYESSVNDCGKDEFEKRSVYWLAADQARKAGRVDASLKSLSNKLVESYMGRAPSKTDIFNKDMSGKSIPMGCWIGGSVQVPSL